MPGLKFDQMHITHMVSDDIQDSEEVIKKSNHVLQFKKFYILITSFQNGLKMTKNGP